MQRKESLLVVGKIFGSKVFFVVPPVKQLLSQGHVH